MCERMFVYVSGVCDIKGLTLLVSHQVWFVHVSPAPVRRGREGRRREKYPHKQSVLRDTQGQLGRVELCKQTKQHSAHMWQFAVFLE